MFRLSAVFGRTLDKSTSQSFAKCVSYGRKLHLLLIAEFELFHSSTWQTVHNSDSVLCVSVHLELLICTLEEFGKPPRPASDLPKYAEQTKIQI